MLWNYLFEDCEIGERFFVQCASYKEALRILKEDGFDDCAYIDKFTDEEAEWMGYDTY